MPRPSPVERFIKFVAAPDASGVGCWLWRGARQDMHAWRGNARCARFAGCAHNWRGHFKLDGRREYAHRAAWLLFRGPIPPGLVVRHVICDNTLCVNPAHLALGTPAENSADIRARRARESTALATLSSSTSYNAMTTIACPLCASTLSVVGVEIQGVYDGVLFWECAACGKRWHRWASRTWQRDAAARWVDAPAPTAELSAAPALPDVDQPDEDAHHCSPRRLRAVLSRRRDSRA